MTDYDSPWKEALDQYFEPFLAFFFPLAHAEIDWSRGYETLDKELQQVVREAELGRRVVDKLVRVWRRSGEEEWVLVHVEVQGQEEADFGRRMYICNYRLFDRYNRMVVSLAVLADERAGWRPDRFGYSLWGCTVGFQFPVVKLLDYATEETSLEASANPFAAVVLAHLKTQQTRQDPETRRAWKLRLVKGLHDRGLGAQHVHNLFRFIDRMMDLPEKLEEQFWLDVHQHEEEKRMPYITPAERKWMKRGLLEGIELGLELKFGAEGLKLLPEIRELSDLELLRAVLRAVMTATTLDQVRQTLLLGEGEGTTQAK